MRVLPLLYCSLCVRRRAGGMVVRGRNTIHFSAADSGRWLLTLQLARRRSLEEASAAAVLPCCVSTRIATMPGTEEWQKMIR